MEVLTRDGHALDLAISLSLCGDLDAAARSRLDAHLAGCAACKARYEAAAALHAAPLPPLKLVALQARRSTRPPPRMWGGWAAAAALAAGALLVLRPPAEEFTARGDAFALEVFRATAQGVERLQDGDAVRAGDRLGFRVQSSRGGWLYVVGQDATGQSYPCYPQPPAAEAARLPAGSGAEPLPAAVALDDTPGEEHLVAIRCDRPFSWEQALSWIEGSAPAGCETRRLHLPREE